MLLPSGGRARINVNRAGIRDHLFALGYGVHAFPRPVFVNGPHRERIAIAAESNRAAKLVFFAGV